MVFSVYYLIFAEAAEEKVRKYRATITVEQLRVSWEKPIRNPYVRLVTSFNAGRVRMLKEMTIRREAGKDAVAAWFYWNGTEGELKGCDRLVLSFTGGGGVSMTPRCHDEYLIPWTKRVKVPILSVNYRFGSSPVSFLIWQESARVSLPIRSKRMLRRIQTPLSPKPNHCSLSTQPDRHRRRFRWWEFSSFSPPQGPSGQSSASSRLDPHLPQFRLQHP